MVDFENDLRNLTIDCLNRHGVYYKEKDDTTTLLIKLFTYWRKRIEPRKREVIPSKELKGKLAELDQRTKEALDKLIEWIEQGEDINGFQGRGLLGQGTPDYQRAMYEVCHLHLSASKEDKKPVLKKNGFAKPGKFLLYAVFTDEAAYLLDVGEHPGELAPGKVGTTEWTSINFLQIIVRNWPELLKHCQYNDIVPIDGEGGFSNPDDYEIAALISSNINTLKQVDGNYFFVGAGLSSDGTDSKATRLAQNCKYDVLMAQTEYENRKELVHASFADLLKKNNRPVPSEFDIHLIFDCTLNRFQVAANNAGVAWDFKQNTYELLK